MYHVRFRDPAGSTRTGEWTDDGVAFAGRTYDREAVEVLPPAEPSKVVCVGRNYAKHVDEVGAETPDRPTLFMKGPNALAGHGDTVSLLPGKDRIEQEGELAVVIGEQCRNVAREDAEDVIAGYTCANDVSNRDDQRQEQNWIRGKAFDNALPLGPALADPEHVPDDATIETRVNGEVRQRASIDLLLFDVPELVEEITTYLTLEPGDVITTGTPEGVAPLDDGDEVEVDIEGVPTLRHGVSAP